MFRGVQIEGKHVLLIYFIEFIDNKLYKMKVFGCLGQQSSDNSL